MEHHNEESLNQSSTDSLPQDRNTIAEDLHNEIPSLPLPLPVSLMGNAGIPLPNAIDNQPTQEERNAMTAYNNLLNLKRDGHHYEELTPEQDELRKSYGRKQKNRERLNPNKKDRINKRKRTAHSLKKGTQKGKSVKIQVQYPAYLQYSANESFASNKFRSLRKDNDNLTCTYMYFEDNEMSDLKAYWRKEKARKEYREKIRKGSSEIESKVQDLTSVSPQNTTSSLPDTTHLEPTIEENENIDDDVIALLTTQDDITSPIHLESSGSKGLVHMQPSEAIGSELGNSGISKVISKTKPQFQDSIVTAAENTVSIAPDTTSNEEIENIDYDVTALLITQDDITSPIHLESGELKGRVHMQPSEVKGGELGNSQASIEATANIDDNAAYFTIPNVMTFPIPSESSASKGQVPIKPAEEIGNEVGNSETSNVISKTEPQFQNSLGTSTENTVSIAPNDTELEKSFEENENIDDDVIALLTTQDDITSPIHLESSGSKGQVPMQPSEVIGAEVGNSEGKSIEAFDIKSMTIPSNASLLQVTDPSRNTSSRDERTSGRQSPNLQRKRPAI